MQSRRGNAVPAAARCPGLIQDRRGIHKSPAVDLSDFILYERHQIPELFLDHIMVILSIGVFGNFIRIRLQLLSREIIVKEGNDGFGTRNQFARIQAFVKMVFHIGHLPVHALSEPGLQARSFLLQEFSPGDTAGQEAETFGLGFDFLGIGALVHRSKVLPIL